MAAIFDEDFISLNHPNNWDANDIDNNSSDNGGNEQAISYAIRLVSNTTRCRLRRRRRDGESVVSDVLEGENPNDVNISLHRRRPPLELALAITYPPHYPQCNSMPTFHIHYCNNTQQKFAKLHPVQEEAILQCAINAASSSSFSSSSTKYYDPNKEEEGEDGGIPMMMMMPCAYDCVLAVQEFIQQGGLYQAGIMFTFLSSSSSSTGGVGEEDCLSHILSYVVTSIEDIDTICTSLPLIFRKDSSVVKSNVIWKELCARRWKTMWGFEERWKKYEDAFRRLMQPPSTLLSLSSSSTIISSLTTTRATKKKNHCTAQHFWMHAYNHEEMDASRTYLTRKELHSMTFDYREWFSISSLRNQPENLRDVLPSGLRTCVAKDVTFLDSSSQPLRGSIMSNNSELSKLTWEGLTNNETTHNIQINDNIHDDDDDDDHNTGTITGIDLIIPQNSSSTTVIESLVVARRPNWGWELRGSKSILRALDNDNNNNLHLDGKEAAADEEYNERMLWSDLTTNMIIQERPGWITTNYRTRWETNYREIPDDEDCKMLDW